jgi:hypothetical protein
MLQMKRINRIAVNAGLFVVASVISITSLEYLIRRVLPQYDPSGSVAFFYEQESNVPLGPRNQRLRQFKNTGDYDVPVDFNKHGLREKKDVAQATAEDYFVVGDSFSFGWGVAEEERYSNMLQEKLATNVFNISVPGDFATYEELIKYAISQGGLVKRLIVGVCMENDLANYEKDTRTVARVSLSGFDLWEIRATVKSHLISYSALYTVVSTVIHHNSVLKQMAVDSGWLVENVAGISKNEFDQLIIKSSIEKLVGITRPYGATILIIPSRGLWVGDNVAIEKAVHEFFVTGLVREGLDVVDMRPVFEHTGNPLQFHFKNDGHWNSLGHRKAAEVLAAHILSERSRPVSSRSTVDAHG